MKVRGTTTAISNGGVIAWRKFREFYYLRS